MSARAVAVCRPQGMLTSSMDGLGKVAFGALAEHMVIIVKRINHPIFDEGFEFLNVALLCTNAIGQLGPNFNHGDSLGVDNPVGLTYRV